MGAACWALFGVGWVTVLISTFLLDHFDLFGLRQVFLYAAGRPHAPLPFRTPTLFTWSSYAEAVRLIGVDERRGQRLATLALMDPGTPAWWTLHVDLATDRVLDARLITSGHFISVRYSQFNGTPPVLEPARPGS